MCMCPCVYAHTHHSWRVCMREKSACVCVRERVCVCVRVCVRDRKERERERERETICWRAWRVRVHSILRSPRIQPPFLVLPLLQSSCAESWMHEESHFAKEPYKRDNILQRRPVILGSLLIVATSYYAWKGERERKRVKETEMGWLQLVGSLKL